MDLWYYQKLIGEYQSLQGCLLSNDPDIVHQANERMKEIEKALHLAPEDRQSLSDTELKEVQLMCIGRGVALISR